MNIHKQIEINPEEVLYQLAKKRKIDFSLVKSLYNTYTYVMHLLKCNDYLNSG